PGGVRPREAEACGRRRRGAVEPGRPGREPVTARARYKVPFAYHRAVDIRTYAGNNILVPCREIRVAEQVLRLPDRLVGKRLRVRIVLEGEP
ncbi:MAG: hypothetical protein ACREDE_11010, partial [Thermoplasmata archaeon]